MLEVMVGMALMGLFLAIFTGAMVSMYHATNKTQGVTDTSAQINAAISRLDSSLRYASAFADPSDGSGASTTAADGNWYVAYQSTYTGSPVCTQLRVNTITSQLQERTWSVDAGGGSSGLSSWEVLAGQITPVKRNGHTQPPFTVLDKRALRIHLSSTAGSGNQQTISITDVTFTALNSTGLDEAADGDGNTAVCQEVGTP